MAVTSAPRVRRTAQNTQYTYDLGRRIHAVHTYPVLSPQGATIFLYGHESGVQVVWRGGRRFKPHVVEDAAHGKQNGDPPADAVMVLDSDDEQEPSSAAPFVDKPQFEDSLPDADADMLFPDITQTLDLAFETPVLHIATLPMAPCAADDAAWAGANLLKDKIVFSVSCLSREVFLVTLPLVPPSPLSKARTDLREHLLAGKAGNGKWGETVTLLHGQEKPSQGLTMTLFKPKNTDSSSRSRSASSSPTRVVVASHTREACGALRLWDVPLDSALKDARVEPFQTEYLSRPLTSISFNPTHSNQILCNASPDALRVYDYTLASIPPDDSEGPFPSQGSWLMSLYPPFSRGTSSRKPILAAAWIAHGRAILALLADGQWGIWDIDGVSPQGPALFAKGGTGFNGDALIEFSVSGHVEGTSSLRNPGSQSSSTGSSGFIPMTPHSRRDAMVGSQGPERLVTVKGGISVTPLPSTTSATADECATLWIGGADHVFVIPGVLKFWDAQKRKGVGGGVNLFSGAQPTRMVRLSDLNAGLMGERCVSVTAMVRPKDIVNPAGASAKGSNEGLPADVFVCGESRLVVVGDSDIAVGGKIGTVVGRSKRHSGLRENSAIIVHPRPEQPSSVAFNLSVGPRRKASRAPVTGLFDPSAASGDDSTSQMSGGKVSGRADPSSRPASGLDFIGRISAAADAEQEEGDERDDERDVEAEMLDIMEIDRELETLNDDRGRVRKKVLFNN